MPKEPLYPHVPKTNKLERVAREIEETVRKKGRLHVIDVGKISEGAGVSPIEVLKRLPEDIKLDEETGYLNAPITPVYYELLGLQMWTDISERYGPDAANHLSAKIEELVASAKNCKFTGPNGAIDHYNDFVGMVDELEEQVPQSSQVTPVSFEEVHQMLYIRLHRLAEEQMSLALKENCGCRINGVIGFAQS